MTAMITDAAALPDDHSAKENPTVLLLASDPPDSRALGGVALHAAALAQGGAAHLNAFTAHPRGGDLHVERWNPRRLVAAVPLGTGTADDGLFQALAAAIEGTGAKVLHVHSPGLGPRAIARAARRTGARLVVTLHDHALACENYTLLERRERHCGIPEDLARCDACLATVFGRPPGAILEHRASMRELVQATDAFVVPSRSVLDLCSRVHPEIRSRAHHIAWGAPAPPLRRASRDAPGGPLRVAYVGLLSREKGRERLPSLLSACRHLDVEWHVFGATEGASLHDVTDSAPRVVLHGAYRREDLPRLLTEAGCHCGFLPSVAAETFSLALSDVFSAGLPALVCGVGALSERVTEEELGWTFDPWQPETLARVVSALCRDRTLVEEAAARVRSRAVRTDAEMAWDHVQLWRQNAARSSAASVNAAALALFGDGERRARSPVRSLLLPLVSRVRGSLLYQDLRLRQLVSEPRRKAVERALAKLFSRERR